MSSTTSQPAAAGPSTTGGALPTVLPAALPLPAIAIAAGLCLLAAVCRFILFDRIEFKYDEAQVSSMALALVRQHVLPSTSILTSGGFHNPPLFVYLVAIPILVSASPFVVTGFVTALDVLAIGGLYLVCRRAIGEFAALAAALLMAVDPMAVHYARKIWAPDLMPSFTVLFFWGLLLALGAGRAWGFVLAFLALGVLVQLHQAAFALLPITLVLILAFAGGLPWRRPGFWVGLLAGLLSFAALLLPYAVFEARAGFTDVRGMAQQVGAPATLTLTPWLDLWQLAAGWNPALFFQSLAAQEHPSLAGSGPADWLTLALLAIGLVTFLIWLIRPSAILPPATVRMRRVAAATTLLCVLVPPALFMRSAAPILPHYLVFLMPFLFVLEGVGLAGIAKAVRRALTPTSLHAGERQRSAGASEGVQHGRSARELQDGRSALPFPVLLLTLLLVVSLVRQASFDTQLRTHATGGDYGTPLAVTLQAVKALGDGAGANGAGRVFVESDSGDTQAVYQYLAATGYAPSATIVDPQLALVFPAGIPASYLFTTTDGPAYQALAHVAGSSPTAGPPLRVPPTGSPAYTVVSLDQQALQNPATTAGGMRPLGPFTVGSGLTLIGGTPAVYHAGAPLDIALLWQVTDPTPFKAQPVRLFVHLYDASRHTVAQQDALGYPAASWQHGDRFVIWFRLQPSASLAPGTYTLVTGLYTVQGFHVFPVRGPHNEDLGGEVPLGTVRVGG